MQKCALPEQSSPLVLITGSSGFLGQAIAGGLIGAGYRVIGLDVEQPAAPLDKMKTIEIDFTSDDSVAGALDQVRPGAGERIASVIHLAAYYDTTGDDNLKYGKVTVEGARRFLDALQRFELEQFVFSSTMLVHAPSPDKGTRINEDSPLDPAWAYSRSTSVTEELIRGRDGAKAVILRFAGVHDEDCRAAFIAQQGARIFERLPTAYLFAGDISSGQPHVHRDDLVDAVVLAVDRRAALPDETTLLIGEAETPSYQELQNRLGRLIHGETWRTLALPKGPAKLGARLQEEVLDEDSQIRPWMVEHSDDHYELDISSARALLGWQPRHSLLATVPEMVRRLKADPTAWYEKNKLDPSGVAASPPELGAARARLQEPLERDLGQVEAAIERHLAFTL